MVAATDLPERIRAKKEMAKRARRLALTQVNDGDRQQLLQLAKELEAEAEASEPGAGRALPGTEAVTRPQQQVQQQQAQEPGEPPVQKD
ncbi:MAG: hypothetical protein K2X72_31365 [Reyranella sp.]|nr:hypothetical protein [Reyranella sp.]